MIYMFLWLGDKYEHDLSVLSDGSYNKMIIIS